MITPVNQLSPTGGGQNRRSLSRHAWMKWIQYTVGCIQRLILQMRRNIFKKLDPYMTGLTTPEQKNPNSISPCSTAHSFTTMPNARRSQWGRMGAVWETGTELSHNNKKTTLNLLVVKRLMKWPKLELAVCMRMRSSVLLIGQCAALFVSRMMIMKWADGSEQSFQGGEEEVQHITQ